MERSIKKPLLFAVTKLFAAALLAFPANAFVVVLPGDAPRDPVEALDYSPRWHSSEASLVDDGERGLGGGLEFSVDNSFCELLNFIDDPALFQGNSVCEILHGIILESAAKWSGDNQTLRLVDVTDVISAERDRDTDGFGHGAELDFFAVERSEMRELGTRNGTDAVTWGYWVGLPPISTNGKTLPDAATRVASDIYFSTDRCYYIFDPGERTGCAHFTPLLVHELGHFYGLSHPDQARNRNIDSDRDPLTRVIIDCSDPKQDLRQSRSFDENAYMYSVSTARNWPDGPSVDDQAGLAFLYPVCSTEELLAIRNAAEDALPAED
jgi:hypothetical protein